MKQFLKKTTAFTLGMLLLNVIVYFFYFRTFEHQDYVTRADELKTYSNFLFADSHGQSIQQRHLDDIGIYNFSYASDSYFDILVKLQFMYRSKVRVDTVFLTIDAHNLSPYREGLNNKYYSIDYTTIASYESYHSSNVVEYSYLKYINRYLPLLNTNNSAFFESVLKTSVRKLIFRSNTAPINSTNGLKNWLDEKNKFSLSTRRIKQQFPDDQISSKLRRALNSIIHLCETNNTTLIGIKFPLTKTYNQILAKHKINIQSESILLAKNIPVFDFQYFFIDKPEYFQDQDHLNGVGSGEFVTALKKQVSLSAMFN